MEQDAEASGSKNASSPPINSRIEEAAKKETAAHVAEFGEFKPIWGYPPATWSVGEDDGIPLLCRGVLDDDPPLRPRTPPESNIAKPPTPDRSPPSPAFGAAITVDFALQLSKVPKVTPEWSSSVYSNDEDDKDQLYDEEKHVASRRVFRISGDDSSSIYSNPDPGIVRSVGPWDYDDEVPRPVSPTLGIFEREISFSRPPASYFRESGGYSGPARTQGVSSTIGSSAEGHGIHELSPRSSFGSFMRKACEQQDDENSLAAIAYPPASRDRDSSIVPDTAQVADSRHVSAALAPSRVAVVNYSRKGQVRNITTMPPHPPPNMPLPAPPGWKPESQRRPDYAPLALLPPTRPAPAIPAPPQIPLRKRPTLTKEELGMARNKTVGAHEASPMSQAKARAHPGNKSVEKIANVPGCLGDMKDPELIPEGLRVRREGKNERGTMIYGRKPPISPSVPSSTSRFSGGTPRSSTSQAPSLQQSSTDCIRPPLRRAQRTQPATSQGESLRQTSVDHFQSTRHELSLPLQVETAAAETKAGDVRMTSKRPPIPTMLGVDSWPGPNKTTGTEKALSKPTSGIYVHRETKVSFEPDERHTGNMDQELQDDREKVIEVNERLCAMGRGYSTQRASYHPAAAKCDNGNFEARFKTTITSGSDGLTAEAKSTTSNLPVAADPKGIKGKMHKVASKLKLRKSSGNMRDVKKARKAISKASISYPHNPAEMPDGKVTSPSQAIGRQRSAADFAVSDDLIPPVPTIPLRHRKTFAQMEEGQEGKMGKGKGKADKGKARAG